mmetsp:Transcript_70152/g.186920  ORF Transcript_70152/g.186920 Transcript_70152/m.186920 type:complete len:212 (+) Transcript_70152:1378-2013(+)
MAALDQTPSARTPLAATHLVGATHLVVRRLRPWQLRQLPWQLRQRPRQLRQRCQLQPQLWMTLNARRRRRRLKNCGRKQRLSRLARRLQRKRRRPRSGRRKRSRRLLRALPKKKRLPIRPANKKKKPSPLRRPVSQKKLVNPLAVCRSRWDCPSCWILSRWRAGNTQTRSCGESSKDSRPLPLQRRFIDSAVGLYLKGIRLVDVCRTPLWT